MNELKILEITSTIVLSFLLIFVTRVGVWITNKNIKTQKSIYNSKLKVKINELEISLNSTKINSTIENYYFQVKNIREDINLKIKRKQANNIQIRNSNMKIIDLTNKYNIFYEQSDLKNKKLIQEIKKELKN